MYNILVMKTLEQLYISLVLDTKLCWHIGAESLPFLHDSFSQFRVYNTAH